MSNEDNFIAQLEREEDKRSRLYDDATGKDIVPGTLVVGNPSIGVGRNLIANPLSPAEIAFLLANDVRRTRESLMGFVWFAKLDEVRQDALANAAFNMGTNNLLHFPHMIAALAQDPPDFAEAGRQLDDPHWEAQVGSRAKELGAQLATGQFQS